MGKPKNNDFVKQSLSSESQIFNPDLSVKLDNFPELDDKNYPAKLKQKLQEEKQQKDKEASKCPPFVELYSNRQRGFHKYRTAAYIHDQGGRGHYTVRPDYGQETLDAALKAKLISERTHETLSKEDKWKAEIAFPRPGSPAKYSRDSKRFLLSNINSHKDRHRDKDKKDVFYLTGSWIPYQWTAHHLIPHEALTEKELGDQEYQLLQESGYDVNNGHNGIIAPACSWAVPMHCVIQHKGNHPTYSADVKMLLEDVKSSLQSLVSGAKNSADHRQAQAALLQRLTDVENELWQHILDLSKQVVPEAMRGVQTGNPHVTFARGKSLFPFGVLS